MSFQPAKVIILRHGEKPGAAPEDDSVGGYDLSVIGYCRAAALSVAMPSVFGKPDFIIASKASNQSNLPIETITPLASAMDLVVMADYSDKEYPAVAESLLSDERYVDKVVVVCWHHGKIPDLARDLGVAPPKDPWPPEVFDRYWVVTPDAQNLPQIVDLPQRLLYGDQTD